MSFTSILFPIRFMLELREIIEKLRKGELQVKQSILIISEKWRWGKFLICNNFFGQSGYNLINDRERISVLL